MTARLRLASARAVRLAAFVLALASLLANPAAAQTAAGAEAWALLRDPANVVLMRHSDASGSGGYGDPPGYRLDDCATQRNLTDEGRAHARRAGDALRSHAILFHRVLTSPWCRCRDTARLAIGRDAEDLAALSNLVGRSEHRDAQVAALRAYLAALDGNTRVLMVTHGIVIAALTGINPASGEMVIVRPGPGGQPAVLGRLQIN